MKLILQGGDNIYDYNKNGHFLCDECKQPVYEGEAFLLIDGLRICRFCVDKRWRYASIEDSSYYDYINREVHEKLEKE